MAKEFIKRWGPVLVWAGVIFGLSSIPTLPKVGFLWWDFVAKKSAHMMEYGILFYLLIRARISWQRALIYGIIYAGSDEIHQLFVSGRTSRLTDLGFDAVGMMVSLHWLKARWGGVWMAAETRDTQKLAGIILQAAAANGINVVSVRGELGAGKTTLVQGIGKELGVKRILPSPTFVLVRSYFLPSGPWKKLYHVDLYRLESGEEMRSTDLGELWAEANNLVVVEWAERAQEILPPRRVEVDIKMRKDDSREITTRVCG